MQSLLCFVREDKNTEALCWHFLWYLEFKAEMSWALCYNVPCKEIIREEEAKPQGATNPIKGVFFSKPRLSQITTDYVSLIRAGLSLQVGTFLSWFVLLACLFLDFKVGIYLTIFSKTVILFKELAPVLILFMRCNVCCLSIPSNLFCKCLITPIHKGPRTKWLITKIFPWEKCWKGSGLRFANCGSKM